jgi:hypothetical protein
VRLDSSLLTYKRTLASAGAGGRCGAGFEEATERGKERQWREDELGPDAAIVVWLACVHGGPALAFQLERLGMSDQDDLLEDAARLRLVILESAEGAREGAGYDQRWIPRVLQATRLGEPGVEDRSRDHIGGA